MLRFTRETSAEYLAWFGGRNDDHIRRKRDITG
jgi:hypothetical protein